MECPEFLLLGNASSLMMHRTQKISRKMNCTTKVRSICTDKSMKNSEVHHWDCSACTNEQVNCPFRLLREKKMPETNFPKTHIQALCAGKIMQLWKFSKRSFQLQSMDPNPPQNKVLTHHVGYTVLGWERFPWLQTKQHCRLYPPAQDLSQPSTSFPLQIHLNRIFQMIQRPDVTGFLITFCRLVLVTVAITFMSGL